MSLCLFMAIACGTIFQNGKEQSNPLSAERFDSVFRKEGWVMGDAYCVYSIDSVGDWNLNECEGDMTIPIFAWQNNKLYYFFGTDYKVEKFYYRTGDYSYDEKTCSLSLIGGGFYGPWEPLRKFKVLSVATDEIRCEGDVFPLVRDTVNTRKCLFVFERYSQNIIDGWNKNCGITKIQ